jgi:hypothetical protein
MCDCGDLACRLAMCKDAIDDSSSIASTTDDYDEWNDLDADLTTYAAT